MEMGASSRVRVNAAALGVLSRASKRTVISKSFWEAVIVIIKKERNFKYESES
jgi:hypothetical protein